MRAINLLPADERRGAGGAGGRSGGAAYILLGLLGILVLFATLFTLEKRSLADKRSEVVTLEAQAATAEARTAELSSFVQFAALRASRTQTVSSLAGSRFDWSHALRELSRVIPANVWLTGLQGTVAPGVELKAAIGQSAGLRAALAVPAVEIIGCTTDQRSVARMVTRMRLIDGVVRVALQSSVKADGGGGGGGGGGDCRQGDERFPQFGLVIFFDQATSAVPSTAPSTAGGRVTAAQPPPSPTTTTTTTTTTAAAPIGATP